MEKKKTKKNNSSIFIVLAVLCIILVVGLLISKNKSTDKKDLDSALKETTKIEDGKVFYQNADKKTYIKFKDENVYEWAYYNKKGKIEKEVGYYKSVKGVITLNHHYQAIVMGDFVEIRNPREDETEAYHFTNYFDKDKMEALETKMQDKILEYKTNIGEATKGAKITDIETEVVECYRYQRDFNKTYDTELICKTNIKLYFKNYDKKTCEKAGSKFNVYAADPESPDCKKGYLQADGYVKYDLNNDYNIMVIYPEL